MPKFDIKNLYYITHIQNLPSILEQGILSHEEVEKSNINFTPIYAHEIVNKRQNKYTPDQQSLWNYANLYFQPRNPMMYRVVHEKDHNNIAIVAIKPNLLSESGVRLTDGNAANNTTQFYSLSEGKRILQQNWKIIQSEWWKDSDGSKRIIMSECLVPTKVSSDLIESIYVSSQHTRTKIEQLIGNARIPIIPEANLFFQPKFSKLIGNNISLIDGDMFFSNMQTLTISVNLQGIMGKGLASRVKYQFPDVYVFYQDICRGKKITAIKPYLYKRETSMDEELSDLSLPLNTPNSVKWFLLFATKRKWRENSRLEDIKGGLDWIRKNAKKQGIKSLALPALGCGLGSLNWSDVGPLMCSYLHDIGIHVAIYLPREQETLPQYLEENYLLK
jgi:O-acetyl-ADP-ribose deacetylase (regulator of RNase III)